MTSGLAVEGWVQRPASLRIASPSEGLAALS